MIAYIPIHSIADIITNSSSVEYIMADDRTIEVFKGFMQDVLKTAGVTTPVDQLFNFELVPDPEWVRESIWDSDPKGNFDNSITLESITPEMFSRLETDFDSYEQYIQYLKDGEDENGISHLYIKITTKDGSDITHRIQDAFNLASRFDG